MTFKKETVFSELGGTSSSLTSAPSMGNDVDGGPRRSSQSAGNFFDDEIIPGEIEQPRPSSDPMELTEQEIFETKLFPGRPDVFGESVENPSEAVQDLCENPRISNSLDDCVLPQLHIGNQFLDPQPLAQPFPTGSPVFNAADLQHFNASNFFQVLGKNFQKYNDEGICRGIIDYFKNHQLDHLFILNIETWTPEHAFLAVQDTGKIISLAVFGDHPIFEELIQELENIALHLNIVFFKNSQIIENLSLH
ncbi:hypothetical protein FO519_006774 [Halicephalobus sp. NKZ332]|nr:hypothetical protein FO519_006774 [Halicephalobus sp. NKZ332]